MKSELAYPSPESEVPARGFASELLNLLKTSALVTIVTAVLVSGVYPAVVWGLSQALFPTKANGSLIDRAGRPAPRDQDAVGSALLGQNFSAPAYFHPRPSSAGAGYDPTRSGGSNLGPTSAKLMFGTTRRVAVALAAYDSPRPASDPRRAEGAVVAASASEVTLVRAGGGANASYRLAPGATTSSRGRSIAVTTLRQGDRIAIDLNDKTPAEAAAITVIDETIDGALSAVDVDGATVTLPGDGGAPVTVSVAATTPISLRGKAGAKLSDLAPGMKVRALVSDVEDFDGIADRVIHYCQDNGIAFTSSIPADRYEDADGIDDVLLIEAFNAATEPPTISPAHAIPADAVTGSGSGLDPDISPANADLQAGRVASARKAPLEQVKSLIAAHTDGPGLGFIGDPGVNVLRLNLALDARFPLDARK